MQVPKAFLVLLASTLHASAALQASFGGEAEAGEDGAEDDDEGGGALEAGGIDEGGT